MSQLLTSVTVVIIAHDECPPSALLQRLGERLEALFTDVEFVIVANDPPQAIALELKSLCETLPDSLIVFLGDRVHADVARLIGIDHSVSDHVLFVTPTDSEVDSVDLLVAPLRTGCDLVLGRLVRQRARGLINGLLFKLFRSVVRWTTGADFEDHPASFRILSRSAALYLATRREGEVLVRARSLGSGFPASEVQIREHCEDPRVEGSFKRDLSRAVRLLTTGSSTLLRVSSYLALIGGVASAVYAVYVLAVFLLVPKVEPGWTTLSLQLSGMLLLFSVQFLLLAENVIHMSASSGISNRRHHIIRELRSPLSRRSARLNVVDQEGRFQLGAPRTKSDGISRQWP